MKGFIAGIGVGAAASATGVAGYLGFQQLIQVDQSKTVGQFYPKEPEFTEAAFSPIVQKIAAASISQPERIETAKSVPFEALSYCDQLDAIAKGRKSVSAFIATSADRGGYLWAVKRQCTWHSAQATQVSQPETSRIPFQALSYCDQLDALDKSGKSVFQFILNSGDFNGYIWAAKSQCSWHREQANVAYLNSPAAKPTRTIQQPSYPRQVASNTFR